jgi:hypothetical protein
MPPNSVQISVAIGFPSPKGRSGFTAADERVTL